MKIPYWPLLVIPAACFCFGYSLNELVMVVNHNQMPVFVPGGVCSPEQMGGLLHSCLNTNSHLKFLSDWITTPVFLGIDEARGGIASIGDLFESIWYNLSSYSAYLWAVLIIKDYNK